VKDFYILATTEAKPLSLEQLKEAFQDENVEFAPGGGDPLFALKSGEAHLEVRFDGRGAKPAALPASLTGSDEGKAKLRKAKGFYRIRFDPSKSQPSVAVFEALWCARSLMQRIAGVLVDVTAFKIHDPEDVVEITELEFDIRDHVNLHAVEVTDAQTPLWIHSHGMEKFGVRDVEAFQLGEEDLLPAESFLHELCTDLAFGHGPSVRTAVETSAGLQFLLIPSEEARTTLMGVPLETFEGHEGLFFTVVSADGRHTIPELLRPYRDRFEKESEEERADLLKQCQEMLPAFKARFQRRGLMEPLTFLARAPFDVHPEGQTLNEDLWIEVLSWEDKTLIGKLVDGATHTTEWRKGGTVEVEEDHLNALALGREGKTLEDEEMHRLLLAERPM
jgi:hypothetical protein